MRLLLVEDDAELRARLTRDLMLGGFAVDAVGGAVDALHLAEHAAFDAVILDRELPDGDGLSVLRALRAAGNGVPVLMLTVRDSWREKVQTLSEGADDYMTKPFHVEELVARVQALIRRRHGLATSLLAQGDLALDAARQSVELGGVTIALTRAEYRLLHYFMLNAGAVLSRTQLYEHIYDGEVDLDSNVIEVYIGHLRKKLGKDFIATRRGQGYVFQASGA